MFDSYIDALCDDTISDSFVHNDSQCVGRNIKDSSSPAMIVLVWHALLEGTIAFDVDQVSPFVDSKIRRQRLDSLSTEGACEQVPGPSTISFRVRHLVQRSGSWSVHVYCCVMVVVMREGNRSGSKKRRESEAKTAGGEKRNRM